MMEDNTMRTKISSYLFQLEKEAETQRSERKIQLLTSTIDVFKFLDEDGSIDVSIATVDALLKEIAKEHSLRTTYAYVECEGENIKLEDFTIVIFQ